MVLLQKNEERCRLCKSQSYLCSLLRRFCFGCFCGSRGRESEELIQQKHRSVNRKSFPGIGRPCFRKQGGWLLRTTLEVDLWLPNMYTHSIHTHTKDKENKLHLMEIQKQQSYGLHISTLKYANQVGNLSSRKHTFPSCKAVARINHQCISGDRTFLGV